jgi:hypothetical protein
MIRQTCNKCFALEKCTSELGMYEIKLTLVLVFYLLVNSRLYQMTPLYLVNLAMNKFKLA